MSNLALIGDVGGTNSRFALVELESQSTKLHEAHSTKNDDHSDFETVLAAYLKGCAVTPKFALFALAGPVDRDGSVKLVNRDWPRIDPVELRKRFGFEQVWLVNDFAAMARAIPELPKSAFVSVLPGEPNPSAPIIVTGPGTGFGVSTLCPLPSGGWHVITGEGGHASYASRTDFDADLRARMEAEHGYIGTEMIVGGAWLQPVFDAVSDIHGRARETITPLEVISAAEGNDPVASQVLALRARSILNTVGDLVLINGGHGGAVLTGSVAEALLPWFKAPENARYFYERGGHSEFLEDVPVQLLRDSTAPLVGGAALLAEKLCT